MKRVILLCAGAVLAAVLQMAWGFTFWMAPPLPYEQMVKTLPAEQEGQVVKALSDATTTQSPRRFQDESKDKLRGGSPTE